MAKKIKRRLRFDPKKLDRGAEKLYQKFKELAKEWNDLKTSKSRKKLIEDAYNACFKQWKRIRKEMAKFGIHIGPLGK